MDDDEVVTGMARPVRAVTLALALLGLAAAAILLQRTDGRSANRTWVLTRAPAGAAVEVPLAAVADEAPTTVTGSESEIGNQSSVVVEVDGAGGSVKVTNSGTASANTGGNVVVGSGLRTGDASAVGNQSTVEVRRP